MLRNNKVNAVIAFVAAILFWMYVVGQVDPTTTGRVVSVPVVFAGEEALAENDLALADPRVMTVDVVIKGSRSDVRKTMSHSERIKAVVDVSPYAKGTHEVDIDITVPNAVEVEKVSQEEVTIVIDDLVFEEFPVEVRYEGIFDAAQEPGNVSVEPETVTVSGAACTVSTIDRLEAVIETEELSEKIAVLQKPIAVLDANGIEVGHVTLSSTEAAITVGLVEFKTVALNVETTGAPAEGFELGGIDCPATVTVKGPHSVVSEITELNAEPIDISGCSADLTAALSIPLPDGVLLVAPEQAEATVLIKAFETESWTFAASEIQVDGAKEGYIYTISPLSVVVTVTAGQEELEAIQKSDLTLRIAADGMTAGQHDAVLIADTDFAANLFTLDPKTVTVEVTAPGTEEEAEQE